MLDHVNRIDITSVYYLMYKKMTNLETWEPIPVHPVSLPFPPIIRRRGRWRTLKLDSISTIPHVNTQSS